jgi:hypothetical protein
MIAPDSAAGQCAFCRAVFGVPRLSLGGRASSAAMISVMAARRLSAQPAPDGQPGVQCGVLALEYRPMTAAELDAMVLVSASGIEAQALVDAARRGERAS